MRRVISRSIWALLGCAFTGSALAAEKRPNILVAIADDATWFHWRKYADENARFIETPTFDRIAEAGVLFENCYTPNPKCAPSRACFLTGRNSWQLEEAGNHCSLFPAKFDVLPDLLECAGYHVGYTGKGWSPGSWKEGGRTRNPAGPEYNDIKLAETPTTGISKCNYLKNFESFLSGRDDGQPFYFWFGCWEPHRSYEFGSGFKSGKKLKDAMVLPYWPDNETVRTDLLDYALEMEWFDLQISRFMEVLEDKGELENTLILVTSDNGMSFPRCKGHVYDAGTHLPLAVLWPEKVSGGRTVLDFVSFRDMAPTLLEAAGVEVPATMSGKSFLPQLLSDQGGQIDDSRTHCLLGREVHDRSHYPVRGIREKQMLYLRNYKPESAGDGPLVIQHEKGYNAGWIVDYPTDIEVLKAYDAGNSAYYDMDIGPRAAEELYDLSKDPYCLHNLAANPEYAAMKKQLIRKMESGLIADEDPRMLGNGDVFESYPFFVK